MKRIFILLSIAISLALRLGAAQIVPSSYVYNISPYGLPDSGGELTDGYYGDINPGISLAAPDPSGWVEFGGAGEVKFTFAENVSINNITLSMARWEPAAVYLPDVLKVNSVDYSGYVGTFNDKDRAFINLDGNWEGTELTIYFSHSQYLFMDEVSFQGTPVPEPSTAVLLSGALILLGISYRSRASKK